MPTISMPAPVGGWNARDAIGTMPATDAVQLINLIPRGTYVESRPIAEVYNGNPTDIVYTLVNFPDTTVHMVAAYDDGLYKITGTGSPTSLDTGFTTDVWQHAYHSGKLILVNGADTPQVYDGSTIGDATITGDDLDSNPIDPTTLYGVHMFKGRAFYWAENGTFFWYAAAGGYQGALSPYDVSAFSTAGIFAMCNLTLDGGDGVDDLLAIIMKDGTVLIYQGDDPGDANSFISGGRFKIPEPLSIRGIGQYKGTQLIMTRQGVVDLLETLRSAPTSEVATVSSKINPAWVSFLADEWKSNYYADAQNYWITQFSSTDVAEASLTFYPRLSIEVYCFPSRNSFTSDFGGGGADFGTIFETVMFVRDSNSGAWCQFQGVYALCMCIGNDGKLYFAHRSGSTAGSGTSDIYTLDRLGEQSVSNYENSWTITVHAEQSPQSMGILGADKQLTAARVWTNFEYPQYIDLLGVDESMSTNGRSFPIPNHYVNPSAHTVPGTGTTGTPQDFDESGWESVTADGVNVSVSMSAKVQIQRLIWQRTDLLFNPASMF